MSLFKCRQFLIYYRLEEVIIHKEKSRLQTVDVFIELFVKHLWGVRSDSDYWMCVLGSTSSHALQMRGRPV